MEAKRPHRARTDVANLDIVSLPAHSPRPLKEEFDDTLLTSSGLSELRKKLDSSLLLPFYTSKLFHYSQITHTIYDLVFENVCKYQAVLLLEPYLATANPYTPLVMRFHENDNNMADNDSSIINGTSFFHILLSYKR